MSKYRKIVSNNNEYLNNIFTPENLQPSITLINGTTEVKFDDYDVYIKFVNTSNECFILSTSPNYVDHILMDGIVYYLEDIAKLWEDLDKNPNDYLSGRIVFPFETTGEEHIVAFKFKNVPDEMPLYIEGGWGNRTISEIVILHYLYNLTTQYEANFKTYYLNNYIDINSDSLEKTFSGWSSSSRDNYDVYLPKDIKYIPRYLTKNLQIDNLKNFYELTDIEKIEKYNFSRLSSENSAINLDLSNFTKLKTIASDSFKLENANNGIDSLILPPNIETLGTNVFNGFYNNVTVEIPESMKDMDHAFNGSGGTLTFKFKSMIPPKIDSLYNSVLLGDGSKLMYVPRGSKADYLFAMTGPIGDNNTKESMLTYYEEGYPNRLAHIIEYDPE